MPPRRNRLEDARRRLQEKLDSIKEQSDYITQALNTTTSNATNPAAELLNLKDKKKFFHKYSQVSQDLEKCLDFLLELSDSVDAYNEGDDNEEGSDDEEGSHTKEEADITDNVQTKSKLAARFPSAETTSTTQGSCSEEKSPREEKTSLLETDQEKQDVSHSCEVEAAASYHGEVKVNTNKASNQKNDKKSKLTENLKPKASGEISHGRPLPREKDEIKAPIGKSSRGVLQDDGVQNNDPSQLRMPKAYSNKKGVKKERAADPKGRRSPLTNIKNRTDGKTPVVSRAIQLKPYPFKNGQSLEVVVTEVLSPWELWIQPADNGFNLLMEKMCLHFAKASASGDKGGLTVPPSVGEYCCARFMDDDTWYRVRVIGVYPSHDKPSQASRQRLSSSGSTSSVSSIDSHYPGLEVEVLCVDDGNRERLPLRRLRHLDNNLADIPSQSLCCALAGVQPLVQNTVKSAGDSLWKEESIEWLRNKVSGVKLLAYPRRTDDDPFIMVDLYLTKARKPRNIPGKDITLPGQKYSIAHMMVSEGLAQYVGHMVPPSSPQSSTSEGQLSMTSLQDAMPVFDEDIKQHQDLKVHEDNIKGTDVTQRKDLRDVEGVTKSASLTQHEKVVEGVTKSASLTQHKKVDEGVTKHNNVTHFEEAVTKVDDTQSYGTTNETKEHQSSSTRPLDHQLDTKNNVQHHEDDVMEENEEGGTQDRASPRHPPEGSSLTDSMNDLNDDISHVKYNECSGSQGNESSGGLGNESGGSQGNESSGSQGNESSGNHGRLYLPSQNQPLYLQVMMSEVVSPSEFYVHLVTPEVVLLAELTVELDAYYKDTDITSSPTDYRLSIGDYCCANFSKDKMWCRARVLDVKVTPAGEGEELVANIHVFYVDYGNSEWVAMGDTRPLLDKFMMLPGFAVKSRLAGVGPAVNQDDVPDTVDEVSSEQEPQDSIKHSEPSTTAKEDFESSTDTANETSNSTESNKPLKQSRKSPKGKRAKKNKKLPIHDRNVILRAAGDESGDSELSDGGLIFDVVKTDEKDDEVKKDDKETEETALPVKYLLPSPDKTEPSDITTSTITRKAEWTEEAVELFKGLSGDDKPLRGVMVPWNARIYQQVYYPSASCSFVDITYQRPTLVLQLYDTTGDEDVDVGEVIVETGLAESCDIKEPMNEDVSEQNVVVTRTLHLSEEDLKTTANQLDKEGICVSPVGSIDSDDMKFFDPMMDDFKSSRNAYKIDTSDLDIAIHGFKPIETQICRFFRSAKSRCWRGENCPFLHVKEGEDASVKVQAFCNNNDFTVGLPKVDSWVGVRVTAVINPGHFWVQFPCGSGPIEKKIIEERLGLVTTTDDDDEDFDTMMERMNKFYSRNLFRDSSTILPAPGELVAAKYSENNQWYRACVLDIVEDNYQVSFVDFGNTEWTAESNVKRMLPQFLHVPFQAVECFLGNVEPVEESGEWVPESMEFFESLTNDKLLIAHVLKISWNNTMWIELFDTQNEQEININEEMIKQGFALESDFRITIPTSPARSVSSTVSGDSSDCDIVYKPG